MPTVPWTGLFVGLDCWLLPAEVEVEVKISIKKMLGNWFSGYILHYRWQWNWGPTCLRLLHRLGLCRTNCNFGPWTHSYLWGSRLCWGLQVMMVKIKMAGGTLEVRSDKSLTLLTFDIWHLTFGHLNIWAFEHLNIWTFEQLNIWTFEQLNI